MGAFFSRITLWLSFIVAAVWLAAVGSYDFVRDQNRALLEKVDQGEPVTQRVIEAAIAEIGKLPDDPRLDCVNGFHASAAGLYRGRAYARLDTGDLDGALADFEQSRQQVRRGLACSPRDANQWVSYAVASANANHLDRPLGDFLSFSRKLAPNEPSVALRRLQLALRMGAAIRPEDREWIEADAALLDNKYYHRRKDALEVLGMASFDQLQARIGEITR